MLVIFFISCGEKREEVDLERDTVIEETVTEEPGIITDDPAGTGESELPNELGMTPGLPADYPSDVPKPREGKVLGTIKSSDGNVVTFETPEKITEVVSYFKEEMEKNEYTIPEGEEKVSDKGGLITWNKGNKSVELMLSYNDEKQNTSLVITYK
jgi:hypothetical protein